MTEDVVIASTAIDGMAVEASRINQVYAPLAKAWLDDEDAVPDKAKRYFEYIVEH